MRLQSKWLENNRAACPVGTMGRKRSLGAHKGGPRGVKPSENAMEKKKRNKTIRAKEGVIEKGRETSEGERERERAKATCCTTGRIEAIPRWQKIEKRPEK